MSQRRHKRELEKQLLTTVLTEDDSLDMNFRCNHTCVFVSSPCVPWQGSQSEVSIKPEGHQLTVGSQQSSSGRRCRCAVARTSASLPPRSIQADSRAGALHHGAAGSTLASFHTSLASSASTPELWLGDSLAAFVEFSPFSVKSPASFPSRFL